MEKTYPIRWLQSGGFPAAVQVVGQSGAFVTITDSARPPNKLAALVCCADGRRSTVDQDLPRRNRGRLQGGKGSLRRACEMAQRNIPVVVVYRGEELAMIISLDALERLKAKRADIDSPGSK